MEAVLISAGVVALAEIGDKTQLLTILLASRFRAPGPIILGILLESVREHHAGLHSLRIMKRMEARRRNARPLRLRFSQSLASLRHRLSHAMVRSTIQRLGRTSNPLA